jgi:hypothetical protein
MRDAPSTPFVTASQELGAQVRIFDPAGIPQAAKSLEIATFCDNAHDCANGARRPLRVKKPPYVRAIAVGSEKRTKCHNETGAPQHGGLSGNAAYNRRRCRLGGKRARLWAR